MSELRVIKGEPSPEELAALVTVVAARAAAAPAPVPAPPRRWAARHHMLRRPVVAGPGAWRDSSWKLGGLQ
ncbi:acyl-CoA carboxylase subunit epsilon [Microtetraspora niveoalba]|uniref:acyl-CoA carboxylase subunit epsilon n=1 Tax=Microtetraspora niveoalba TaxID=46175 RepID=UPI00083622AE|nr:acyl-CoA carboxylase subunit epsilon [Microtetraspora niveoalba]